MIKIPVPHQPQIFLPPEDNTHSSELSLRLGEKECVSLIKNCKSVTQLKQVHAHMLKLGLFWNQVCVKNLITTSALSSFSNMDYASSVFYQIDDPSSFEFNIMIRGHVNDGGFMTAIYMFFEMLEEGNLPDNYTFPFALKACATLCMMNLGMQFHGQVFKLGFHDDVYVQNSLINMYGKCGAIKESCAVFENLEQKSVASWSSFITAHANLGMWKECLEVFGEMMREGSLRAEESILVSIITACTHLGALDVGKSIHGYLMRNLSGMNVIVETSLIDMYIKCGSMEKGLALFERMSSKNRLSYSVMISGLAMHGYGHEALRLFSEMLDQKIEPDDIVYLGVLSACRHAGLVEEGLELFEKMRVEHNIHPTSQQFACVVDLLGRAGRFDEAFDFIRKMPMPPDDAVWRSLLNAARLHDKLEIAEEAARNLTQLDSVSAGDYIVISNMYARAQRWSEAAAARTMVAQKALDQTAGISLVEVRRKMYSFASQDKSHSNWEEIYEMIHQMEWQLKFEGYVPDISEIVLNVDAEEKREILKHLSLKLALAFALLQSSEDTPIRIVRNVKMCKDSHTYTKFISVVYNRKIIVRDRNRFHHFTNGTCSCRDYW